MKRRVVLPSTGQRIGPAPSRPGKATQLGVTGLFLIQKTVPLFLNDMLYSNCLKPPYCCSCLHDMGFGRIGKHFIATVINRLDLVPTFSDTSVEDLRSEDQ